MTLFPRAGGRGPDRVRVVSTALARPLLLLAILCAGCAPDEPPPTAPPRIGFRETSFDWGRVAQGSVLEHVFPFDNHGGMPLAINRLRTACDCSATLETGGEIPVNGTGGVRLRCDTDTAHGPQRHTLTVYSNDPAQRTVLLTAQVDVAVDVVADPPRIYLGTVPPGVAELRAVNLLTGSGAHFADAVTDAPQLIAHVIDGPDGARLMIGTTADAPEGPFTVIVRVPTTSALHPVLRVPVAGTVAAGDRLSARAAP